MLDVAHPLRGAASDVVVRRPQEGAYVVAASNPHVLLAKYDPHESGYCPAYDKDPRAFFASLGLGTWPPGTVLCGGVPVPASADAAVTSGAAPRPRRTSPR